MKRILQRIITIGTLGMCAILISVLIQPDPLSALTPLSKRKMAFDAIINQNANQMVAKGRQVFRFDTFGSEDFWGGQLGLHTTIAGADNGGVGPGLTPAQALGLGLKVDVKALPQQLLNDLSKGLVDLNNPKTTLALLKLKAVVGVAGFFNQAGQLTSVGIQCALCHSTVDNQFAPGIGNRLDGWANRDLNVGAIIAFAPNMQPFIDLLQVVIPGIDAATVRAVLSSWGPGKFDAELALDGKATNPQQITNGVVTGTNVPGATMLPNAFGLAGTNQHTWTGAWGTVSYWNGFVANIEMRGKGNFFDPRLNNAAKYPIAAAFPNLFGNIVTDPDLDLITSKLPDLHFYQLAIPAPEPTPNVHFNPEAARRGGFLFAGKAGCVACHKDGLGTEPGWNLHTAAEMLIDSFQADRSPDNTYRTSNLAGIFVRELGVFMNAQNKGRFYHDGRFPTLLDVVGSYNARFTLGLTQTEMLDIVEYLKSL